MTYILQTTNLTKTYKQLHALKDVNISIPEGSIYGLVGNNGAGKTTFMRMIAGLISISSGTIRLYGATAGKGLLAARKRTASIIETPTLVPTMSAMNNLKLHSRILGISESERMNDLLEDVGFGGVGNKKVKDYSLGMKQRLGIALCLLGDPDFLLLDEPANGLDPIGNIEIRELLIKLNKEHGKTILISSHILSELSQLATHYGFLDNGILLKELDATDMPLESLEDYYVNLLGGKKS